MKTAMQELIQGIDGSVKIINEIGGNEITIRTLISIKNVATDLLEKEKEQIIDAYNQGALDGESSMLEYPNYFDKTYNQNK